MQSISSLGAATIRDLVEKFGDPYEAWCALQNRKNLTTILGIPSTKYRQNRERGDRRTITDYL